MATQFEIDCALMAGAAYVSTRSNKNIFPIPDGWFEIPNTHQNDPVTGFEASRFTNGLEIVISYAGTYNQDIAGDIVADLNLGTGASVGWARLTCPRGH